MENRDLRRDVIDELDFEPSVDATNIGVAVNDGVVTLTGHVSNYAEKIAAERAAWRVKGVCAVAQEIEVRFPGGGKTADDEIAKRAVDILRWNAVVPRDALKISVHGGWITLAGEVEWQYQKRAAEDAVRKLSGVIGVINNVKIKTRVQTADVKRKIEDALRRSAEIEAQGIAVNLVGDGKVTLEGKVHDWQERSAAESAAWSAAGVTAVANHLTIA